MMLILWSYVISCNSSLLISQTLHIPLLYAILTHFHILSLLLLSAIFRYSLSFSLAMGSFSFRDCVASSYAAVGVSLFFLFLLSEFYCLQNKAFLACCSSLWNTYLSPFSSSSSVSISLLLQLSFVLVQDALATFSFLLSLSFLISYGIYSVVVKMVPLCGLATSVF